MNGPNQGSVEDAVWFHLFELTISIGRADENCFWASLSGLPDLPIRLIKVRQKNGHEVCGIEHRTML